MEAVALIVEYNPLHNGHLHHLQAAKQCFPDATIIAILNGDFLQRGEPALLSKYERTQLALLAGVDLVFELPFAFGTQRADIFARGAIQIASALGAGAIVYGTEGTHEPMTPLALLQPNQKLAYFYEQEAKLLSRPLALHAIPRLKTQYNATAITDAHFASATALRTKILNKTPFTLTDYVPKYTSDAIKQNRDHLGDIRAYYPYLQYALTDHDVKTIALSQSGLGANMTEQLQKRTTFTDFFASVHHKHTSKTHIQRALTYRLTRTEQATLDEATTSLWTRLLGASPAGRKYLRHYKLHEHSELPIIPKLKDLPPAHRTLQYNALIAYATITNQSIQHALIRENTTDIIHL